MLGIVVYEHVVRDGQDMAVHIDGRRYDNLRRKRRRRVKVGGGDEIYLGGCFNFTLGVEDDVLGSIPYLRVMDYDRQSFGKWFFFLARITLRLRRVSVASVSAFGCLAFVYG